MSDWTFDPHALPTDTGRLWRGVERDRLRPLLERCAKLLNEIQWGGTKLDGNTEVWEENDCCPSVYCGAVVGLGERHHEHCPVAALLADLRKELES